jgi:hypothetical protein
MKRWPHAAFAVACLVAVAIASQDAAERTALPVVTVDTIGFTVSNMERALDFYTRVLPLAPVSDVEVSGRPFELLSGVFGARARVVTLALGDEMLELTEYQAPRGRPSP